MYKSSERKMSETESNERREEKRTKYVQERETAGVIEVLINDDMVTGLQLLCGFACLSMSSINVIHILLTPLCLLLCVYPSSLP